MPRGQGRNGSNVEKVAGRRNCSFLRSSLGESNNKFFPEERQISALVLGNTEQRINELVSGGYSPNSYMYGDPLKLECLSLHDLHPASWYAVAWYPIYRIPEGNFRAAFLTYHSLGHFIHQSASSNMAGDFTRIISPVVGLQSYNAKKECWFRPRDMKPMEVQKEEGSPSKLLEERLKTLEQTAFVMATATVCKGNQRPVNNHPDYNHFSSRW